MSFLDLPRDLCGLYVPRRHRTDTGAAADIANPLLPRLAGYVLCLCLVLTWGAQAAESDETRQPEESKEPATTQRVKKTNKDPSKLRRFVPTEKITADSAISFPVDI